MESLPDARRRHQILAFHIDRMRANRLIAPDVNPEELVARTRNFCEAELEYLITTAQRIAMGRLIVIGNQVEVDPALMITENDFFHALEHDIEPVSHMHSYMHMDKSCVLSFTRQRSYCYLAIMH